MIKFFPQPFTAYRGICATHYQNFYFNLRRDHQKNSYERREYESEDENSQSYTMSQKTMKKFRQ